MHMELEKQRIQEPEEKTIETLEQPIEEVVEDAEEIVEEIIEEVKVEEVEEPIDCVALTVREDYKMVVARNVLKKGAKMSWKVALSTLVMHFLNIFL